MSHELQNQYSFVLDENQSLREEVEELKTKLRNVEEELEKNTNVHKMRLHSAECTLVHEVDDLEQRLRWFVKKTERVSAERDQLRSEVQRLTRLGERVAELETENFNLRHALNKYQVDP